jgi:hypothetical protein
MKLVHTPKLYKPISPESVLYFWHPKAAKRPLDRSPGLAYSDRTNHRRKKLFFLELLIKPPLSYQTELFASPIPSTTLRQTMAPSKEVVAPGSAAVTAIDPDQVCAPIPRMVQRL